LVAHRVARAEQVLGYSVADYHARPKLMLALALRRIRESASLF
jgi:DNA-binding PucR family transcriptional regulator